ncbi:UPF0182 family protein [Trichothermofontia sp.]
MLNIRWRLILGLMAGLLGLGLASTLIVEGLWFQTLGYGAAFRVRLSVYAVLWLLALSGTALFLGVNLHLARQLRHPRHTTPPRADRAVAPRGRAGLPDRPIAPGKSTSWPGAMPLWVLLLAVAVAAGGLGVLLMHYGQEAAAYWYPEKQLTSHTPTLPRPLTLKALAHLVQTWVWQPWHLLLGVTAGVSLITAPLATLSAIAVVLALCFGTVLAGDWTHVLLYFHAKPLAQSDPLFHLDIGTYLFRLPIWELLLFWLLGLSLYALIAVFLAYILSGDSLSQGRFVGFTPAQQRHLCGLGGVFFLVSALGYWLSRYELLFSDRGVTYGASYTDITVQLPINTALAVGAGVFGLLLLGQALANDRVFLRPKVLQFSRPGARSVLPNHHWSWQPVTVLAYGALAYLILASGLGYGVPALVQRFDVQPNELARERPYILRSLEFTRQAFGLQDNEIRTFSPEEKLTLEDLLKNDATIRNIRLWDERPLLQTNRQLQQIRLYYRFYDADIDRYHIRQEDGRDELQQVLIAARELDYSSVPAQAQTWVNEHLVYTHGYGFTLSPVNTVGQAGLPFYFVRDIGGDATVSGDSALQVSSPAIRASIPIGQPRLYYGELTNTYVMTGTRMQEFDYPSGDDNVYTTYAGRGGVAIGTLWRRLLFSVYLRDWQMLFTRNFTADTRVLFRRNIQKRVKTLAPFLQLDQDPYLVVADADLRLPAANPQAAVWAKQSLPDQNYLYWIIDAYTVSNRYPYSEPGTQPFNYIRNSVKIVVDAYNGSVYFYVADPADPLIQAWNETFPGFFQPLTALPDTLINHIRYPIDLFNIQSERLLSYHMRDAQVFYNREDQWRVPSEIYGDETQPVAPYYLIMKIPQEPGEEFILLHPFTPIGRNNLIAWFAGRSDGVNYGKRLLYQFPKERLIYGPEQIEARINQDPIISQQISLWNRRGSRVIQGNLLVIPIEQSLLYVEPLYLEAERNSLPTLARVIVAYENRIVMAATLKESLDAIFLRQDVTNAPAIVRPLAEEDLLPLADPSDLAPP